MQFDAHSLKTENAGRPARRLAAAAAALAVLTAFTTGSDSRAQSLNVSTPSLSAVGGAGIEARALGGTRLTMPIAPVAAPKLPPVTPPAPIEPPSLPVKPLLPEEPSLPDAPSLPRVDGGGLAGDRAEAVGGGDGESGGEPLRPLGSLGPNGVGRSGAATLPPTSGASASASTPAASGLGTASLPNRSELAKLPPAQRRELIRRAFDAPLDERRLRQLRKAIRQNRGCLRVLPNRGRRVLELRAGLLGGEPASRRAIGRQIGASPRAVMRLERSSLHRLIDAGEGGRCVGGSTAAAFGGLAEGSDGSVGMSSGGDGVGDGGRDGFAPAGEVLADVHEGGPSVDLGDGKESPAETLLFFLLALLAVLGPLAAIAIASRRRAGNAAAAGRDAGERPLLFLDVDGVLALDPFSEGAPPGRMRLSPLDLSYVPDRAGPLVCELATRFDIVWATGWEHRANTDLLKPLGLREQLPVLTFGKKARFGSSDWKIKRVKVYAGNRPAAWLDDNFVARHERWAAHRSVPTLLVRVDSRVGLAPEHVKRLIQWADGLAPSQAAKPNAARRLRAS